jgi:acetate kinase
MSDSGKTILVINTGSSSVKFAFYTGEDGGSLSMIYRGELENIGSNPKFRLKNSKGETVEDSKLDSDTASTHEGCFMWLEDWLDSNLPEIKPSAVGHRIVHGGSVYTAPVRLDNNVLTKLEEFDALAPLHQPYNLSGVRAVMSAHPGLPQVACFDTSFHRTQPETAEMFGLPLEYYDSGVRRYGFHGLSYEYIAGKMKEIAPSHADGRVIIAHLGNGASMCAIKGGKSMATTMGFTAVDGLPMGTRSGSIDPGVIFYLMREKGLTADEVEELVYKKSGLLGISGITNDMKVLQSSDDPRARLAVDYFVYRAVRETGSLAAAVGGLDAFVFTAGIGENSPYVREKILSGLGWLGVQIDEEANNSNSLIISTSESKVPVYIIPTNEELMIARHTARVLGW